MKDQYLFDNETFVIICEVKYQGPFKYNHMKGRRLKDYESNSYKYLKSLNDGLSWGEHYISFRKFGFLYEPFQKFLLDIHANGIFWILHERGMNDTVSAEFDDPKVVLTMQMLSAGFYVWLFCVTICCIVFACEVIIVKIERSKNCEIHNRDH